MEQNKFVGKCRDCKKEGTDKNPLVRIYLGMKSYVVLCKECHSAYKEFMRYADEKLAKLTFHGNTNGVNVSFL